MKNKIFMLTLMAITIVAILSFSFISCTNTPIKEETIMTESDMTEEKMSEVTTKEEITIESMDNEDTKEEAMISYMDIAPAEAKKLIDENPDLIIIDVSPNYDNGHLPGAVSYYIGDGSLEKAIPTLDPDAKYLVYCHVDSAAIAGAQALIDAGFKNVYRLEGNYSAWVEAGYPVEK